ncbi:MAG: carboxylating nicotinate-nucleotide diphosphorylase [Solirubrobacterales bacterium]
MTDRDHRGRAGPPAWGLEELVRVALAEDVGARDVTAEAVVPAGAAGRARIVQKAPGVLFGMDAARETMRQCGVKDFRSLAPEGEWREEVPADVAVASGAAASLLAAERTALNLLCHLSGIATLTARHVREVAGSAARILDTRKTTPGLRALEKQAVAAGGGTNHRMGLYDAILIKENHVALAGGLEVAVARARETGMAVEVECRDLGEVGQALAAGADRILLDNMAPAQLSEAVAMRGGADGPAFEASGGVHLGNVAEVAATGVDFISVGALTHSAPALDLSMLIETGQ